VLATVKIYLSIYHFDDKFEKHVENLNIQEYNEDKYVLIPRGWTALYDAIGITINSIGEKLSLLAEEERPEKNFVIVLTDGEENQSKEFSVPKIKEMIKHQEDKYNWSFIFLGANIDSYKEGSKLGYSYGNTINAIFVSDGKLYASEGATNTTIRVRVYDATTLTFIGETPNYGNTINTIFVTNGKLYVGGLMLFVSVYDATTLAYIGQTPSFGGTIFSIIVFENIIYVGGVSFSRLRTYNATTFNHIRTTSIVTSQINSIDIYNDMVYVGGGSTNGNVKVFNKSDLVSIGSTVNYGGVINTIKIYDNKIYVGGTVTNAVRVYDATTLAYIGETSNYGGAISSIAIK
jgi:hypothetical protein